MEIINEVLFRAIKRSQPKSITRKGKVASALFKDDNGVSVDKGDGRTTEEVIEFMKQYFTKRMKGVVSLKKSDVNFMKACVIPAPTTNDEHHAEIYKDCDKTPVDDKQALYFARHCKIEYWNEEIEWIDLKN